MKSFKEYINEATNKIKTGQDLIKAINQLQKDSASVSNSVIQDHFDEAIDRLEDNNGKLDANVAKELTGAIKTLPNSFTRKSQLVTAIQAYLEDNM